MYSEVASSKRKHQMSYTDIQTFNWVDAPDNNFKWNWIRGAIAGSIAYGTQYYFNNLLTCYKHIRTVYHPPINLNEGILYARGVFTQNYFLQNIRRQVLFGMSYGAIDMGLRIAAFRYMTGGITDQEEGFAIQYWKRLIPTIFSSALTCWVKVPFEISYKAFYADQKFPKELRRNYTGIFDAFLKIGQKNPMNLFKNGYPSYMGSFFETLFAFHFYDIFRDYNRFYVNYFGLNKNLGDYVYCGLTTILAVGVSIIHEKYLRNLVEKRIDQNSKDLFKGNYRRAHTYMNIEERFGQQQKGYKKYFARNFLRIFITLQIADRLGIFNRNKIINDRFPYTLNEETFYYVNN